MGQKVQLVPELSPKKKPKAASIDNDELLIELCGEKNLAIFRDVKTTSMDLARAVREVIAEDLSGTLPAKGKQILTTAEGKWRLAPRRNSDNTTEEATHRRMKVGLVQVFGELTADRRARGWITVEDLYRKHGVKFSSSRMRRRVIARVRAM